jgi:hypothetical protein
MEGFSSSAASPARAFPPTSARCCSPKRDSVLPGDEADAELELNAGDVAHERALDVVLVLRPTKGSSSASAAMARMRRGKVRAVRQRGALALVEVWASRVVPWANGVSRVPIALGRARQPREQVHDVQPRRLGSKSLPNLESGPQPGA